MRMRMLTFLCASGATLALIGCGGGGSGSVAGGGVTPTTESTLVATAKVSVDLVNNTATITPDSGSRAVFGGGAVKFNASTVLNEGTPARRVLNVTMEDLSQEQALANSGKFRILFSNFAYRQAPTSSLVGTVRTTTFAGSTPTVLTTDGSVRNATFYQPSGLAYERTTDTLYVYDGDLLGNLRVIRSGAVTRVSVGDLGQPTGTPVAVPPCRRFPKGGVIYPSNTKLIFVDPDSNAKVIAGSDTYGSTNGADALSSTFSIIGGLSFRINPDGLSGVLWMADQYKNKLRRIDLDLSNPSYPYDRVSGPFGNFGIINSTVSDGNLLYLTCGNFIYYIPESLVASEPSYASLGGVAGDAVGSGRSARFNSPSQLTLVGKTLYVADTGNNVVKQISRREGTTGLSPDDFWVSRFSGTGQAGSVDGTTTMQHNAPYGIVSTGGDRLFVSDFGGGRIREINPLGTTFTVLNGTMSSNPTDLPVLANPDGYFPGLPTNNPYQEYVAPVVTKTTRAGGGVFQLKPWQFIVANGAQTFDFTITVEAETQVLAALPSKFNAGPSGSGSIDVSVRTLVGGASGVGADGPYSTASFKIIQSICASPSGEIFVAEQSGLIRRVKDGRVTTIAGNLVNGPFDIPSGIACSPDGNELAIVNSNASITSSAVYLLRYNGGDRSSSSGWSLTPPVAGLINDLTADNALVISGKDARFKQISSVVYASNNTLYLSERIDKRIRVLATTGAGDRSSSDNWTVSFLAGSVSGAEGGSVDGLGANARFVSPARMAVSPTGEAFVADSGTIRRLTPDGRVTTFAGNPSYGFADGSGVSSARFSFNLGGLAVDAAGFLYVADNGNYVVRRVTPQANVTTVAGNVGQFNPLLDGTGQSATMNPAGVAVLPTGDVVVAEAGRLRLLQRIIRS